ncbi:rod-binding protein [Hydrogenimonas thermophila]|uniref:Rod binding protein n=1 Tax=Hydrogenimonas thermophila TaxID=223786 RepID=A0A1I5MTC9_9BACT|nr:rod-binding protein [Hydrogenimonas thermophila]SFP12814.1 Rod binding protein [Hydrogenimonas thermophila]
MQPININQYQPAVPTISSSNKDEEKLREQTDAFEAIILKMMLDKALDTKDSLLPEDPGRKIYKSMQNDEISKQLSGSFGYSELLYGYLTEQKSMKG